MSQLFIKSFSILPLIFLVGCANYTQKSTEIRSAIYSEQYTDALTKLEKSDIASKSQDEVLYKMERGMIMYLSGNIQQAVKDWARASDRIDELYTTSISRQIGSVTVNDTMTDFEGEPHEQIMLPLLSSIAFMSEQKLDEAIIETRRTARLFSKLSEKEDTKSSYTNDPLINYISGIIYEAKEEWDNAIIEYKKALNTGKNNTNWTKNINKSSIAKDLGRLGDLRHRDDILSFVKSNYPDVKWENPRKYLEKGEVIIFYECGKSPIKVAEDLTVVGPSARLYRISIPKYETLHYSSKFAHVLVNGKEYSTTKVMANIGDIAKDTFAERKTGIIARMTARIIAKAVSAEAIGRKVGGPWGEVIKITGTWAGAASEVADTRSWTSLPDTIQVLRIPLAPKEKMTITIQPEYGKPYEETITLNPGEKRVLRYRSFN